MVGWLAMIPSDNGRRRLSTGYLRCRLRKGGAILSGLSLIASREWHCAQCMRAKVNPLWAAGDDCAAAGATDHDSAAASAPAMRRARIPIAHDILALFAASARSASKASRVIVFGQ